MTRAPIPNCPQPETPIRERAWADGQRPEPKYSDAEIIDRVAKAIADKCGNGMREKYEDVAQTIVESLLASRPSTPDKAWVSDADVEEALSEFHDWIGLMDEEREDAQHRVAMRAALAHFASQSAEAVRDGERYRWLRDNCKREWYSDMPQNKGAPSLDIDFSADGHDLDSAIDAAMQEQSHD